MKNSFKKFLIGGASGALALSLSASPANAAPSLYSLGGATVSGTFSDASVITATPNQWSLTDGGATVTTTNTYDWIVCTVSQTTSTTVPANSTCNGDNNKQKILANGTVGSFTDSGPFTGASLTLTQTLLGGLNGKYLMVMVNGQASGARGGVFMQTCGPITAASTCSVSVASSTSGGTTTGGTTTGGTTTGGTTTGGTTTGGTTTGGTTTGGTTTGGTTTGLPPQSLVKEIPVKVKAGKAITIGALTKSKVAVKVKVTGKGCKVAAVKDKKNKKKIASYKVTMGKKGVTCTVTVTAPATPAVAALNSVTAIKVS